MKKVFGVAATLVLSAAFAACGAKENNPSPPPEVEAQIAERIAPPGEVVEQGVATATAGSARSGADIYQAKCVTCHGTGAAGAPKLGDKAAWEPRIGKGMDTLYASAIGGFLGMPPKGLCMDCSDAELQATVDYMVENSQ